MAGRAEVARVRADDTQSLGGVEDGVEQPNELLGDTGVQVPSWRQLPEALRPAARTAFTISHAMLRAADNGEWIRVKNLEESRRARLEDLFSAADTSSYDALRDFVRVVTDIDARVLSRSRDRQRRLSEQMEDLRRGRRAQGAYSRRI